MFESALFDKREESELGPDELCSIMVDAQIQCYGDALDVENLHPFMWAAKNHYYHASLNFYNFPYAFGQLFAMGLYKNYEDQTAGFEDRYIRLLQRSGSTDAVSLCRSEGINIETPAFWQSALDLVRKDIEQFCELAGQSRSKE